MEKRKLLIAEGSEDLRTALADLFRGSCQVQTCSDGNEARQALCRFSPDVMVLDLMLPGLDGITLLQWARDQGICPTVLATTRFCNDYVAESAQRLGVSYLMIKPCSLNAIAARVADLNRRIPTKTVTGQDPEARVGALLLALGIPTKLRGSVYLRQAILLYARDPLQSITKMLYPEVAKCCGCAPSHVERCIRSAVDAGWKKRDNEIWKLYFRQDGEGRVQRPSNGAFISRLAESLDEQASMQAKSPEFSHNDPENP